jgi:two-component system alkaline phosphatase synthesis response regulator PhoP
MMTDETILVVDDNLDFARTLERYTLAPLGYTVLFAANGQRGLQLAVSHQPDLILLDMNMPSMNGMEMLRALRQTDCTSPVIFMTMHKSA